MQEIDERIASAQAGFFRQIETVDGQLEQCRKSLLSVLPVVLGKGVRLFGDGLPRSDWRLDGTRPLPSGVVQLRYRKPSTALAISTMKPES